MRPLRALRLVTPRQVRFKTDEILSSLLSVRVPDYCVGFPQRERFPDEPQQLLHVFNSPQRIAVRRVLHQKLTRVIPAQVAVEGVGGIGNSHNLLRFVHEARGDGHLVVYVHTAENWIRNFDNIRQEFVFGLNKFLQGQSSVTASNASAVAQLKQILTLMEAARMKRSHAAQIERWSEEILNAVEQLGRKLIFLLDQDNRLSLLLKHPSTMYAEINDVILSLPTHLSVIGASANNEGFPLRNWDQVIQLPDDPEELTQSRLDAVFPTVWSRSDVCDKLRFEYNWNPLMCGKAERWLREGVDSTEVRRRLEMWVLQSLRDFRRKQTEADKREAALSCRDLDGGLAHDRRFFFTREPGGSLEPLFPTAQAHAMGVFPVQRDWLAALSPGAQYEETFYLAAPNVLVPVAMEMERVNLPRAWIDESFVRAHRDLFTTHVLFRTCARAQAVDFFSWDPKNCVLTAYQLTTAKKHRNSAADFASQQQKFLNGQTLLEATQNAMHALRVSRQVQVCFAFVTHHASIHLVGDGATHTSSWPTAEISEYSDFFHLRQLGSLNKDPVSVMAFHGMNVFVVTVDDLKLKGLC